YGTQGDYAAVSGSTRKDRTDPNTGAIVDAWPNSNTLWSAANWFSITPVSENQCSGPFRMAQQVSTNAPQSWTPRDTMAYWTDGTSNQIIVGEKNTPQVVLGKCWAHEKDNGWFPKDVGTTTEEKKAYQSECPDCSVLFMGKAAWANMTFLRSYNSGLANGPEDRNVTGGNYYSDTNSRQWGGIHPGVCNFLMGDGSVRALSNTIPTGQLHTSTANAQNGVCTNSILARLGCVYDGQPVSF
ncbi:MAG: DUF1559 domain-containing protein, partial [Planctomycetia bacterium]|nr:DUF1559 domain-containing protein [Planctomycetia bacterium]